MTNSADPDETASSEANWSGSTLFAKVGHIPVQQDQSKQNFTTEELLNEWHPDQIQHTQAFLSESTMSVLILWVKTLFFFTLELNIYLETKLPKDLVH